MMLDRFIEELNKAFAGKNHSFEVEQGRKYNKVLVTSHGQRSVYCFVDRDGNIYKAASFKAPAKGVRATLASITQADIDAIAASGYATTAWLYR